MTPLLWFLAGFISFPIVVMAVLALCFAFDREEDWDPHA